MSVIEGPAHDLATRRIGVLEKELVETKKRFETMFQIAERRAAQVERAESCTDQMAIKLEDIQGRLTAERDALREALRVLRSEINDQHTKLAKGSRNHLGKIVHQKDRDELRRLRVLVAGADAALSSTDGE